MNTDNISCGDIFKNYSKLCEALEIEPKKPGKSRDYQVVDIKRFINFEKLDNGHPLIVTDIYKSPLPKRENIRNGKYKLIDSNPEKVPFIFSTQGFPLEKIYTQSTMSIIWKCEECNRLFFDRVMNVTKTKIVKCSHCFLSKGARKLRNILDRVFINYETEYSFEELKGLGGLPLRFDFAIKDFNNELLGIIEYDGGFHDIHEETMIHDKLKDDYCTLNKIPLLRIHHTVQFSFSSIIEFLKEIGCEFLFEDINEVEVSKIENELLLVDSRLEEINNKLIHYSSIKRELKQKKIEMEELLNEYR